MKTYCTKLRDFHSHGSWSLSSRNLCLCISLAAIVSRIIQRRRSIAPSEGRPLPPASCRTITRLCAWHHACLLSFFFNLFFPSFSHFLDSLPRTFQFFDRFFDYHLSVKLAPDYARTHDLRFVDYYIQKKFVYIIKCNIYIYI